MQPFNFIIVDDHKMLSAGLSSFLTAKFPDSTFGGAFESAEACLDFLNGNSYGHFDRLNDRERSVARPVETTIAIVDLNLAGIYSFPLIKELSQRRIKVLVYTMYESSAFAMRSIECGAQGYVLKGDNEEELVFAINEILSGRTFVAPSLEKNIVPMMRLVSVFSPKEKSVAEFVMQGMSNEEIAAAMNISRRTVENYLSHMYDKIGVRDRDELKEKFLVKNIVVGGGNEN